MEPTPLKAYTERMKTDPKQPETNSETDNESEAILAEHPLTSLLYFYIFWQSADLCTNASLLWIKSAAALLLIAAPFAFCLLISQWTKEKKAQDTQD